VIMYRLLVRRLPRGAAGGPACFCSAVRGLAVRSIAYVVFTVTTGDPPPTLALGGVTARTFVDRLVVLGSRW
jgi:hypothetical protein